MTANLSFFPSAPSIPAPQVPTIPVVDPTNPHLLGDFRELLKTQHHFAYENQIYYEGKAGVVLETGEPSFNWTAWEVMSTIPTAGTQMTEGSSIGVVVVAANGSGKSVTREQAIVGASLTLILSVVISFVIYKCRKPA